MDRFSGFESDNETNTAQNRQYGDVPEFPMPEKESRLRRWFKSGLWLLLLRPVSIFLISLFSVALLISLGFKYIDEHYIQPVDPNDKTEIEVVIKKGLSVTAIANLLEEKDIIRNKILFKLLVDFNDMGGRLKAGTYKMTKAMSYDEIIDMLVAGDGSQTTVRFTIPEGYTVADIAALFVRNNILSSNSKFLELAKSGEAFQNYAGINELDTSSRVRMYNMEGYLFPDTYEIFVGASEEDIIKKMLTRFGEIYTEQYTNRATELGLTMDEVITLASMIQREAKTADFKKVSAVFHNRLRQEMPLQSDVTVQYAKGVQRLILTEEDMAFVSPYNTFTNVGLPPGPICNPGEQAIIAALYPDEQMMEEGYLYFCLGDPATGETVFAKTKKEHDANVAKYKPLWEESDRKKQGG